MADTQQIGMRVGNTLTNAVNYAAQRGIDITTDDGISELTTIAHVIVDLGDHLTAHMLAAKPATNDAVAQIKETFKGATETSSKSSGGTLEVAGTQHGDLPDWLFTAAKKAGCTRVWDNRDRLADNPKRPWFKAADDTLSARGEPMAFWPPKG
ncbi:MAG: hypothetical protein ACPGGE_05920 [Poseidonia sp.]